MKRTILALAIVAYGVHAQNYDYCENLVEFPSAYANGQEGFPAELKEDGSISPHASVNFKREETDEGVVETLELPSGENNPFSVEAKFIITRDSDGNIKQVVNESSYKGTETSSGLGGGTAPMMGGGFGGYGGYGFGGPSRSRIITDVKMVDGKCFPKRQVLEAKTGNHTHRSFLQEPKLCHDIMKLKAQEENKDSRISKLKNAIKITKMKLIRC